MKNTYFCTIMAIKQKNVDDFFVEKMALSNRVGSIFCDGIQMQH